MECLDKRQEVGTGGVACDADAWDLWTACKACSQWWLQCLRPLRFAIELHEQTRVLVRVCLRSRCSEEL